MELHARAWYDFRVVPKFRCGERKLRILHRSHRFRRHLCLHAMSGEQVARDAVQPFPIPLEIEMCFHPARDDSHLTDLRRVRFLLAGRQRARHFGKPLGEQVIVAMDARLVICKRHGAVELAFPCPVDFADVAKELGVRVARPQPGFFRQILQPARG